VPTPKPIPGSPRTLPRTPRQGTARQGDGEDYRSFAQRFWLRIFVFGLFACGYGSLEFFAGKVAYPNLFDSPLYAPYFVFVGLAAMCAALLLRARAGE